MKGEDFERRSVSALVPAAGLGERLGLGPKAFLPIAGRPILNWVVEKMKRVAGEVVVAVPQDRLDETRTIIPDCKCIAGGSSRQETVELLADASIGQLLLLHDAARPFCSVRLLERVCIEAYAHGVAGAFLPPRVPGGLVSVDNWLIRALPSQGLVTFQAPQAFRREELTDILSMGRLNGWTSQSTVELALLAGVSVKAVEGEASNIKITTKDDWILAQNLKEYLA